jgi:D-arabinose 1-dehydrogenase-like Zn-dependent alcohol dehydrogenase
MHSCQTCDPCTWHLEQYCKKKVIWTCSVEGYDGIVTQGRYSIIMVCKQEYVILILCVLWFLCNTDPLLQYVQIKSLNL